MADNAVTEPSIDQLRALVAADKAEAAPEAEPVTPAPSKEEKPAPASDPELTQEQKDAQQQRGEDGKFKSAKIDEDAAVPAGVQKRIDKAIKAQREAERQRDEALAKLPQVTPPAKTTAAPAAPKQEDFATYDEYSRAIARFEARQEIDKELVTQREAAAKAQRDADQAKRAAEFGAAEVEARKAHADYDEVTGGIEWPKSAGSAAMAEYLLASNNAPLYYALGKEPEELKRIAAMPPILAVGALVRFESKLSPSSDTPAEKETKVKEKDLPKPPKNVGGGGSPSVIDLNDPKLSVSAFKREFQRRLKAGSD